MRIHILHAFEDNFIFAIEINKKIMIVDPGEAEPVLQFLKSGDYLLDSILLTHCHHDHIGGVQKLLEQKSVKVYGPNRLKEHSIVPDQVMTENSSFEFENTIWTAMHLPGHTLDHLAYFNSDEHILFCGDILFSLGCGRLFEGSFEQAYQSLQRIKSLPTQTKIYFAHEYTLTNCKFHLATFKNETEKYRELCDKIQAQCQKNQSTVPTLLEHELKYNGFLRSQNIAEFSELRVLRNNFVPKKEL
jgi:hydroxyacylglutathione hydrolase